MVVKISWQIVDCFDIKFAIEMDFPVPEDVYFNWDTYYTDPFTNYEADNVIYPNSQVSKCQVPSSFIFYRISN